MEKKIRKSNFELLRIIGMMLIIVHHYVLHSGINPNTYTLFSTKSIFIQFIGSFGKLGVTIFVLISAYFLIESKIQYKKLVPLVIKFTVFSILITFAIITFTEEKITTFQIIKSFFPILWGNWFIVNYILLYLFLPFINKILKSIDINTYKKLLTVIMILWSIIPTLTNYAWYSFGGFDYFIFIYITGSYIRLHYKNNNINYLRKFFNVIFIMFLLIFLTSLLGFIIKSDTLFRYYTNFYSLNSFLPILGAIYIFLHFKNIDINSNIINNLSSSTLAVYLIHDNDFFRNVLWNVIFPNADYVNNNLFIPHLFLKVILTFFICVVIDKVYVHTVESFLINIGNVMFDKVTALIRFFLNKVLNEN